MSVQESQAAVMSDTNEKDVLVRVRGLKKHFPITAGLIFQHEVGAVKAVDDISFDIYKGETLGLERVRF